MLYLSCQMSHLPLEKSGSKERKSAIVWVGYAKAPQRLCDSVTALCDGFFICSNTMSHTSNGFAFGRAMTIIHTIAELDAAFDKAEAVASTNSWIWEQFTGNRTETMAALGLALHTELSTIYEEEQV